MLLILYCTNLYNIFAIIIISESIVFANSANFATIILNLILLTFGYKMYPAHNTIAALSKSAFDFNIFNFCNFSCMLI